MIDPEVEFELAYPGCLYVLPAQAAHLFGPTKRTAVRTARNFGKTAMTMMAFLFQQQFHQSTVPVIVLPLPKW